MQKKTATKIVLVILFSMLAIIILFPILCLIIGSMKPSSEIVRSGLNASIDLDVMSLNNYKSLFTEGGRYFIWFKNSILVTVIQTILSLLVSATVAYGFAMYDFRMKKFWFACMMIIMMIPTEIIMLPLYKEMISFHLIDRYAGVILPFIAAPIPIFFFYQYLQGISPAFLDAARVDGCTEIGIYIKIMLPLMAPAFASMGIYQGMVSWNNFLWPLIVLKSNEKMTLPIGLSTLLTPYGNNYEVLLAGAVMAILPVLILFLMFQKYFIAGMTAGGVKG